jgi:hypothetical protein
LVLCSLDEARDSKRDLIELGLGYSQCCRGWRSFLLLGVVFLLPLFLAAFFSVVFGPVFVIVVVVVIAVAI